MDGNTEKLENKYHFFAFISYKRADSKWADWLYRKLQSYLLPAAITKVHQDLPKKLTPVFLDKEELLPGDLSDNLRKSITQSKYFISICSRNSQINPQYIDLELQFFLETHNNDYTKVIPFIVEESAQPEKECFSPGMQRLCREYELIGVNVTEKGKHRAFLKVIACMHGLLPSEIESADELRQKKQRLLAAALCSGFLALCVYGAMYWWNHIAVQTDYYLGYVWEQNVPRGVDPISDPEHYVRYYRFETQDSRVQQVELLNDAGTLCPVPDEATVLNQNASRMVFTYSAGKEKHLASAKYFDHKGLPIIVYEYSEDGTHVRLLQDEVSGTSGYADLTFDDSTSFSKKAPVSGYQTQYDPAGRPVRRCFTYGEDAYPISDENGVFGYDLRYDALGNLTGVSYFASADGQVKGAINGVHTIEYGYAPGSSYLQWVRYWDPEGNPVTTEEGWVKKTYTRNDRNAMSLVTYLDEAGEPVLCSGGYASLQYVHEGTVLKERRYYDRSGQLTTTDKGYAREVLGVNEAGEIVSVRYFDPQGNPVMDADSRTYGYDAARTGPNEQCLVHVDQNGQPMMTSEGYAYVYTTTDAYDSPIRKEYRDADNQPRKEPYAACTFTFDEIHHRMTQWRFFDEQGAPKFNPETGCAAVITEYDNRGYITMEQYLDEAGNLTCGNRDFAKYTQSRTSYGNYITEITLYYDEQDKPAFQPKIGAMGTEATIDEKGNLSVLYYLGENKQPFLNESVGYAGVAFQNDENGYVDGLAYYGNVLQPVMVNGFAAMYAEHDDHGNLLYRAYYDEDGQYTVLEEKGYAAAFFEYNGDDRLTLEEYFGVADGELVLMVNPRTGYAAREASFDENGRLVGFAYYGAENGQWVPIVNEAFGCHMMMEEMEEDGSRWTYFFGVEDGKEVLAFNPVAGCVVQKTDLDANGNLTGIHYLDAQGKYMNHPQKGYAFAKFTLDDQGELQYAQYAKVENGRLVSYRPSKIS